MSAVMLTTVRRAMGLSQIELDRRAKLPRGTVQALEAGSNKNPTIVVCDALVQALRRAGAKGVTIDSLFAVEFAGRDHA